VTIPGESTAPFFAVTSSHAERSRSAACPEGEHPLAQSVNGNPVHNRLLEPKAILPLHPIEVVSPQVILDVYGCNLRPIKVGPTEFSTELLGLPR